MDGGDIRKRGERRSEHERGGRALPGETGTRKGKKTRGRTTGQHRVEMTLYPMEA